MLSLFSCEPSNATSPPTMQVTPSLTKYRSQLTFLRILKKNKVEYLKIDFHEFFFKQDYVTYKLTYKLD